MLAWNVRELRAALEQHRAHPLESGEGSDQADRRTFGAGLRTGRCGRRRGTWTNIRAVGRGTLKEKRKKGW